jgi:hypothetical protein
MYQMFVVSRPLLKGMSHTQAALAMVNFVYPGPDNASSDCAMTLLLKFTFAGTFPLRFILGCSFQKLGLQAAQMIQQHLQLIRSHPISDVSSALGDSLLRLHRWRGTLSVRGEQSRRRLSRRDRTREKTRQEKQEKLKDFPHVSAKGFAWSVLFFGLLVALVAALVMFLVGNTLYAAMFFLFGGFVGVALLKWGSS